MVYHERPDSYYIPDNLKNDRKFFHLRNRCLVEAGVVVVILYKVLGFIPMGTTAKIITYALVLGGVGLLFAVGIKGESVTEFIMSCVEFAKKMGVLHFRRCDQKIEEGEENREKNRKESIIQRTENLFIGKFEEQRNKDISKEQDES